MAHLTAVAVAVASIAVYLWGSVGLATAQQRRPEGACNLAAFEAILNQHTQTISQLKARLDAQVVGFHVDFGKKPYDYVNIASGASVLFNRIVSNIGGGYDQSTGMFTAPVSGMYQFSLHLMGGDHNGSTTLAVHSEDGRDLCVAYVKGRKARSSDQGSCTTVAQLDQGRGVSVRVYTGQPNIWGSCLTSFSGVLVHSD